MPVRYGGVAQIATETETETKLQIATESETETETETKLQIATETETENKEEEKNMLIEAFASADTAMHIAASVGIIVVAFLALCLVLKA